MCRRTLRIDGGAEEAHDIDIVAVIIVIGWIDVERMVGVGVVGLSGRSSACCGDHRGQKQLSTWRIGSVDGRGTHMTISQR